MKLTGVLLNEWIHIKMYMLLSQQDHGNCTQFTIKTFIFIFNSDIDYSEIQLLK